MQEYNMHNISSTKSNKQNCQTFVLFKIKFPSSAGPSVNLMLLNLAVRMTLVLFFKIKFPSFARPSVNLMLLNLAGRILAARKVII